MAQKPSDAMLARARRVRSETQKSLGESGSILYQTAKQGTQQNLYDRTPLEVTHRMERSLAIEFAGNIVRILYRAGIAPHAAIRLAKTGISRKGGHDMDMRMDEYMERNARDKIRNEWIGCQTRIHKG